MFTEGQQGGPALCNPQKPSLTRSPYPGLLIAKVKGKEFWRFLPRNYILWSESNTYSF